ncbi:Metaxin-1 [Madurella mycetomatis]|uniref:Metaxin-1 n=1 Tax=Madurella mycetomatis TaxID=100816 RepID=A0A175WJG9_9PEZI|nr:Metaxin-1 [Madurella mycetomatis]
MVLQLYVWGPAFGLPSIDAECLAAIAYLAQTTSPAEYRLIQSSPSAVPTQHLPALYNPSTDTWTSGYSPITRHLSSHPPRTFHDPAPATSPGRKLEIRAQADSTAYTAFLTSHAAPLLALSLYVSSANYRAATRPAYSHVLPLPLPWTEPPAVRAAHARRAAHLGMSRLDTDAAAALAEREEARAAQEGWVTVPASLRSGGKKKGAGPGSLGLGSDLKTRIQLEALVTEVFDVLVEVDWEAQMASLRCLGFAYLALMAVPEVPRPWLREIMERRYAGLREFVESFRRGVFGAGAKALPWVAEEEEDGQSRSAVTLGARFARGVLAEVPWLGEQWCGWWVARKKRQERKRRGLETIPSGDLLLFSGVGMALMAVGAGIFFYRGLPPFGAAVQLWRKPVMTLGSLGAAGAMFSGAFYGMDV